MIVAAFIPSIGDSAVQASTYGTFTMSIPSTQPWTDTGLTVQEGDQITITASGTIIFADPHTAEHTAGPDGKPGTGGTCSYLVTDATVPGNSLVGNVASASTLDGKGFFVGTSYQGAVPISNTSATSGTLFLGYNDGVVYCSRTGYDSWGFEGDNQGSFEVQVTISPAPKVTALAFPFAFVDTAFPVLVIVKNNADSTIDDPQICIDAPGCVLELPEDECVEPWFGIRANGYAFSIWFVLAPQEGDLTIEACVIGEIAGGIVSACDTVEVEVYE